MKKIALYFNTLSYLSITQIYFLAYNKIVKKILFDFFLFINKKSLKLNKKSNFNKIRNQINVIFGKKNLWSLGLEKQEEHQEYFIELKKKIITYSESGNIDYLKKMWVEEADDIELNFNYQRFYLFKEVFEEINLDNRIRINLLLEWVKINKKNRIAWTGFNCAMRLVNWMKILQDIDTQLIQKEDWDIIEDSIYQQYLFNKNNIDYHIPSNHIVLQYYSVWLIANIFNSWIESELEKNKIRDTLLKEFEAEFSNDGLHFELTTHYHLQITLLGLSVIYQLDVLGEEVPTSFFNIITKAIKVLELFMIGDYLPPISDGCYNFFHENKYQDLKNLNYLQEKFLIRDNEKSSPMSVDNNYIFSENHLFKIIFDVGNISLKSTPGHGHSDLLSIILGYNDAPIFIDPGTLQYKNSNESLKLKKTCSHNTVSLGEEDQAKLWGFFRWAYLPKNINSSFDKISETSTVLEGEFNGYRDLGGVNHKRKITIDPGKIIVKDILLGNLCKKILVNFILHPEVVVEQKENILFLKSRLNSFQLKCSNQNPLVSVEEILIYDSYNVGSLSKKIVFQFENNSNSKFSSEILFEVAN